MSETDTETADGESPIDDVTETIEEQRERVEEATEEARETVEERIDEGLDAVNDNVVDVLSNVLDTRSRADVYVALRGLGEATADEIAEQTGLYPETVEETLEGLEEDEIVESDDVGGDTFYTAIAPLDLVTVMPRRLGDRISEFFEADDERRVLSPEWAPFRLIVEPKETESETEIAVE